MRLGVRSRLALPLGLGLTLTAPAAHADIPLPSVFGFLAPAWVAWLTFGISFVIVTLVEGVILSRVLRVRLGRGVYFSFVANLGTTVIGAVAFAGSFFFLFCFALIFPILHALRSDWALRYRSAIPLALFPLVTLYVWMLLTLPVVHRGSVIFGSLIPAFLVTTFIEALIIRKMEKRDHITKAATLANLASYALLALTLIVFRVRPIEVPLQDYSLYSNIVIPHLIARGEVDEVDTLVDQALDLHWGRVPRIGFFFTRAASPRSEWRGEYWPAAELRFAALLIRAGRHEHAMRILETTLEMPNLSEEYTQELRQLVAECREAMESDDLRDSPGGVPGD